VLRNASGTIKRKVKEIFNETLSNREQKEICTLIYYPGKKLHLVKSEYTDPSVLEDWYFITINRLVKVCRSVSSKYTRSKVHKALPADFSFHSKSKYTVALSKSDLHEKIPTTVMGVLRSFSPIL